MELQETIILLGNGILLPFIQTLLNKYVQKEYRSACVTLLSIIAATVWTYIYAGSFEVFIANAAMILATSQTIYFKIIKPSK